MSLRLAHRRGARRGAKFVHAFVAAPTGVISLCCIVVLGVIAIAAPAVFGHAATTLHSQDAYQSPSWDHPFGTDALGRDEFARVMVATRLTLTNALIAASIAGSVGLVIGVFVALGGRRMQFVGKRLIDASLGIPDILVAILIVVVLGSGGTHAAIAVGIANWPFFARLAATLVTDLRARDFVQAAEVLGVGRMRVAVRYILPNVAETLLVAFGVAVSGSLIQISSLSFLGLGVQPPQSDWGSLLSSGLSSIYEQPGLALGPALALMVGGLTVGLFADAMGHALNPLLWTGRSSRRRRVIADRPYKPRKARGAAPSSTSSSPARAPVIEVRGLLLEFGSGAGATRPVRGVDLVVHANERVGIVGESGSGKTLTAQAVGRLVRPPARVRAEVFRIAGHDVKAMGGRAERRLFGRSVAMVFQDPSTSLNPVLRVGTQMIEGPRAHRGLSRKKAKRQAIALLDEMDVHPAEDKFRRYPHQLSGGMRQRAVIAMGLGTEPLALIADEPTTALDVTVQAQVLRTMRRACQDHGMALILISHNIGVVAQLCERVLVMYGGRVVEELSTQQLRDGGARHPYTRALLAAVPEIGGEALGTPPEPIPGDPPDVSRPDIGCSFAERCPFAMPRCRAELPLPVELSEGHRMACWLVDRAEV